MIFDWQSAAVWRAVERLEPMRREVIKLRFLRKAPLARIEVAKKLKEKFGRRFRRARTIKALEESALRTLAEALRAVRGIAE